MALNFKSFKNTFSNRLFHLEKLKELKTILDGGFIKEKSLIHFFAGISKDSHLIYAFIEFCNTKN